jgi:hypothetical protein
MSIFVGKNGRAEGPYPEETVRAKLASGELALSDLGWRENAPGWVSLSQLLGIQPPPISSKGPPPIPASGGRTSVAPVAPPRGSQTILAMIIVPALGVLGAYFDMYVAWTLLHGIDAIRSDANAFASEHPLVALFLRLLFPDLDSNAEQTINAIKSAALILLICGVIGALVSVLFFGRRFSKVLAAVLIVCGIAPMFHHPLEFVGLPMTLAGLLGFFVRDKQQLSKA